MQIKNVLFHWDYKCSLNHRAFKLQPRIFYLHRCFIRRVLDAQVELSWRLRNFSVVVTPSLLDTIAIHEGMVNKTYIGTQSMRWRNTMDCDEKQREREREREIERDTHSWQFLKRTEKTKRKGKGKEGGITIDTVLPPFSLFSYTIAIPLPHSSMWIIYEKAHRIVQYARVRRYT